MENLSACAWSLRVFHRLWRFQSKFDKSATNDGNRKQKLFSNVCIVIATRSNVQKYCFGA